MSQSVSGNQEPKKTGIKEEALISLLEEKLSVNRFKQKIGEIIVRKKIETRMVQVPVRWEKLIVEQVGSPSKQLAEINLGQGKITGIEFTKLLHAKDDGSVDTVNAEFISPKAASDFLEAIATHQPHECSKVRIEIIVDDREKQITYQQMFDRYSKKLDSKK
jgi:hypothetical protein